MTNSDLAVTKEFEEAEIDQEILECLTDDILAQVSRALLKETFRLGETEPAKGKTLELAKDFALEVLGRHGNFLCKIFQGEGFDAYLQELKSYFQKVVIRKPDASRARSAEIYVLATGYQSPK